jgi:hypothetical protein
MAVVANSPKSCHGQQVTNAGSYKGIGDYRMLRQTVEKRAGSRIPNSDQVGG